MRTKIISLLMAFSVVLSICIMSISVSADDTMKTSEVSKGTPVMDNIMDDIWNTTPTLLINRVPNILDTEHYTEGTNFNPRNVTGTFKVLWDENNLYIYADIKDPKVKDADDRFNVFVSPTNHRTAYQGKIPGQTDPKAPSAYADSDVFIKFERNKILPTGPDGDNIPFGCYEEIKGGLKQKRKDNGADGWVVETCIPWPASFTPSDGVTIGFDCEIDDQDPPSNFAGFIVWNQPNEEAWHDPSQAGQLVLKNVASMEGDGNTGNTDQGGNNNGDNGNNGNTGNADTGEGNNGGTGATASNGNTSGNTSNTNSASSGSTGSNSSGTSSKGTSSKDKNSSGSSDKETVTVETVKSHKTARIVTFIIIVLLVFAGVGLAVFFILHDRAQYEAQLANFNKESGDLDFGENNDISGDGKE